MPLQFAMLHSIVNFKDLILMKSLGIIPHEIVFIAPPLSSGDISSVGNYSQFTAPEKRVQSRMAPSPSADGMQVAMSLYANYDT